MKITSAEFIKSAFEPSHWVTDGRPEIAFLGRSNVGKSSLINSLLNRKGLARTSNTPGRTQSINFFLINEAFYFVDLPGYGYARVSKATRSEWRTMAEGYLFNRRPLVLCIQLIDSRHSPTDLDVQLGAWLAHNSMKRLVVATKIDKLSQKEKSRSLAVAALSFPGEKIITYSAKTGLGRDGLWNEIIESL